jgi:hypothetical protein
MDMACFPSTAGIPARESGPGYEFGLDIRRSKIDIVTALLFQALLQNWCGRNCRHGWEVENLEDRVISMRFDDPGDALIFQLTEEYDFFNRHADTLLPN